MSTILATAAINMAITATLRSALPAVSGNAMLADTNNVALTIGSGVGAADGSFTTVGNVSSGTPVTIDFTSLHDPFGNAVTTGHVVGLKITNLNTNLSSGTLAHGGGSNPLYAAMPAALAIAPTDSFCQSFDGAGLPVTGGSAQNLQLSASAGTVTYQVTALLRST